MVVMVGLDRIFTLLDSARAVSWASSTLPAMLPKRKLTPAPAAPRPEALVRAEDKAGKLRPKPWPEVPPAKAGEAVEDVEVLPVEAFDEAPVAPSTALATAAAARLAAELGVVVVDVVEPSELVVVVVVPVTTPGTVDVTVVVEPSALSVVVEVPVVAEELELFRVLLSELFVALLVPVVLDPVVPRAVVVVDVPV